MEITFSIGVQTATSAAGDIRIEAATAAQSTYSQPPVLLTNFVGGGQGTSVGDFKCTSLTTSAIPNLASNQPKHFVSMVYATIHAVAGKGGGGTTYETTACSANFQAMPMRSRDKSFFMNHGGRRF